MPKACPTRRNHFPKQLKHVFVDEYIETGNFSGGPYIHTTNYAVRLQDNFRPKKSSKLCRRHCPSLTSSPPDLLLLRPPPLQPRGRGRGRLICLSPIATTDRSVREGGGDAAGSIPTSIATTCGSISLEEGGEASGAGSATF